MRLQSFMFQVVAIAALAACGQGDKPNPDTKLTVQGPAPDVAAPTPSKADVITATTEVTPASEAPPTAPEKVTSVEGITEYRLDNGLRVLLFPDPSKTTITVACTYLVGSRHEGYGETGMAHLLEHMLFKGTPSHKDIWGELQKRGADFNGSTDYDRTNYYETVAATDDNLEWALDLEADRMVHSNVANEDLQKEFSVVRNEFETGENDPFSIMRERMLSTAYLWHNYGKSVIGSRADIERVPVENLRRFYETFYQPDNALLVVSGKIDAAATLARVNKKFGVIPKPTRVLPASYTEEPVQDGERAVTLARNGDTQWIGAIYHTVAGTDEAFVASEALAELMTGEPSGRLYRALVETGMASRVVGITQGLAEPGVIEFYAQVPADRPLAPVREKLLAVLEGLATEPPTEAEVKRFQAEFAKGFALKMTSNQEVAVELSEWQAQGDWRLMFVHRDRVAALEPAAVAAVAAAYLKASNRTMGTFVPDKAPARSPTPGRPDVAALVKDYAGQAGAAEGEAFEATIANIERRTTRVAVGGVKLVMLPKSTRGKAVRGTFVLHVGSAETLAGRTDAGDLVPEMLLRGTEKHDYQALKDELARLKAEIDFGNDGLVPQPGVVTATFSTVRESLPEVLALLAELLKTPTFPAEQFTIAKKELLAALEDQLSDPQSLAFVAALRALFPYPASDDVRAIPSVAEAVTRVRAVTLDDVKAFHKDLYGASNAELAIVGDFDQAEVQALVTTHFGAWASPKPFTRVAMPFLATTPGAETIDTPDKEGGFIAVAQGLELRDDDPDYPALLMANYVLGGGSATRLNNRLRQKEGWSYGAFSALRASAIDTRAIFLAGALVNPQNAPKAMAALIEETALLLSKGIPDAELANAKESWKSGVATELANDQYVVTRLAQLQFLGRTMAWDQTQNEAIAALTAADVAKALAKGRVAPEAFARFIAADPKKAGAEPKDAPAPK